MLTLFVVIEVELDGSVREANDVKAGVVPKIGEGVMAHHFDDNSVGVVTEGLEVPLDELSVPELFGLGTRARVNVAVKNKLAARTCCCA